MDVWAHSYHRELVSFIALRQAVQLPEAFSCYLLQSRQLVHWGQLSLCQTLANICSSPSRPAQPTEEGSSAATEDRHRSADRFLARNCIKIPAAHPVQVWNLEVHVGLSQPFLPLGCCAGHCPCHTAAVWHRCQVTEGKNSMPVSLLQHL